MQSARNALFGYGILMALGLIFAFFTFQNTFYADSPYVMGVLALQGLIMAAMFGAGYYSFKEPVAGFRFGLIAIAVQGLIQLISLRILGIIVVGIVAYYVYQGYQQATQYYGDSKTKNDNILDADLD